MSCPTVSAQPGLLWQSVRHNGGCEKFRDTLTGEDGVGEEGGSAYDLG